MCVCVCVFKGMIYASWGFLNEHTYVLFWCVMFIIHVFYIFLICLRNIIMDLCNQSCLLSCMARTLMSDIRWTIKFFHTCHAYRHHWLLPFYTLFSDLDPGCGSQGQRKAKPLGFIFLHTIWLMKIRFEMMLKQFKLKSWFYIRMRVNETREMTAFFFTDCVQKD